jgi:hypothetical protein
VTQLSWFGSKTIASHLVLAALVRFRDVRFCGVLVGRGFFVLSWLGRASGGHVFKKTFAEKLDDMGRLVIDLVSDEDFQAETVPKRSRSCGEAASSTPSQSPRPKRKTKTSSKLQDELLPLRPKTMVKRKTAKGCTTEKAAPSKPKAASCTVFELEV